MRPVNLIPPEHRHDRTQRPLRTGPVAYLLIGGMVAVLGAVTLTVTTSNKIAESKAEMSSLQAQQQEAEARVASLKPYADFAAAQQARMATVTSLAQSRFDWDRVLRELALVIPPDVTLETLTGTAGPDVAPAGGTENELRAGIAGPALSLGGCASSHDGVAELMSALEDIDGVTRVGLDTSEVQDLATGGGTCVGGAEFAIVAGFDNAPAPGAAAPAPAPSTTTTTGADAGVAQAAQQQADAASSIQQGAQSAETAVNSTAGG